MRCCFLFILCLLFSQHIYAEQSFWLPEQCLLGSWQSDKEKTLEYNLPVWEWAEQHNFDFKITPKGKEAHRNLFGKMIVTFYNGISYISWSEPFIENGTIPETEVFPYKIVQAGKNFLVGKSENSNPQYGTFFFEDVDTYYIKWTKKDLRNQAGTMREYFRRITPTPKECVMP